MSQVSNRFQKLDQWRLKSGLTIGQLRDALNAVPGRPAALRPRTQSAVHRLLTGQIRFADPWLASEIEHVTGGEVSTLDYLRFVAERAAAQFEEAA